MAETTNTPNIPDTAASAPAIARPASEPVSSPVSVLAVFTRDTELHVPVRPYDNKSALTMELGLEASWRALPETGHFAVTQRAKAEAKNAEGVVCLQASVTLELIAAIGDVPGASREEIASRYLPAVLFAHCRSRLATLTMDTGYGVVHLPPLESSRIPAATPVPGQPANDARAQETASGAAAG